MFGSYSGLAIGLAAIVLGAALWRALLFAFRRQPIPFLLRSNFAEELSTVTVIGFLAVGAAYLVTGLAAVLR